MKGINLPDIRDSVQEGDRIVCQWFDNSEHYHGVVEVNANNQLGIETPQGFGLLARADHVVSEPAYNLIKR